MANYQNLLNSIAAVIRTNGNQEITGAVLQSTLQSMVSVMGANATYGGVAHPTDSPGTPDGPVVYVASEGGIYTNFGAISIDTDELAMLLWNPTTGTWSKESLAYIADKSELEQLIQDGVDDINDAKTDAINDINVIVQSVDVTYDTISGTNPRDVQLKNGSGDLMMTKTKSEIVDTTDTTSPLTTTTAKDAFKVLSKIYDFQLVTLKENSYNNQYINPSTGKWATLSNSKFALTSVSEGDVYKIIGGNVNTVTIIWLSTNSHTNGSVASIVPDAISGNYIYLHTNEERVLTVPSGAHYLYILWNVSGQDRTPVYFGIRQNKQDFYDVPYLPVHVFSKYAGYVKADGTSASSTTYEMLRYRVDDFGYVRINAKLNDYITFIFSTSSSVTGCIVASAETGDVDKIVKVPTGALFVFVNHNLSDTTPAVYGVSTEYAESYLMAEKASFAHPVKCAEFEQLSSMALGCKGRYMFARVGDGIGKYDIGVESEQTLVGNEIASHGSDFKPCGCAVNGNYLYLATRNRGSGEAQTGSSTYGGYLDIIDISSWSVVNTISYPTDMTTVSGHNCYFGKATGVATYDNYLAVALNLGGFKLYDITDRENPTEIGAVDTRSDFATYYQQPSSYKNTIGAIEYQSCTFYHDGDGNLRLNMTGYGDNIVEIYNPASTITARTDALCKVSFTDLDYVHIKSHTKGVAIKYPYVYSTIGAWPNIIADENRQVGLIVTDITDLTTPVSKMVLLPLADMCNTFSTEGSPYSAAIMGNHLVFNNYGKGFAVFSIDDPANPKYNGLFGQLKAGEVLSMNDGRLICSGVDGINDAPFSIWRGL